VTRSSDLISRFGAEFLANIIVAISAAALIAILARLLTADEYGLLFFAISILGVIQVFSKLGIAKSAARYISEYKEQDTSQIYHIIRTSLLLNLASVTVVMTIVVLAHQQLAAILGESEIASLLLFGILYLLFGTLFKYVRYVLQGFEAIEFSAAIHATDRVVRLMFSVGFVVSGYGVIGAMAGYVLGYAIATSLGFTVLYLYFIRDMEFGPVEEGLQRRVFEYTIPLTATSTANVLDKRVDTILIGVFLTPLHVSYYVVAKQVIEFVQKPVRALGFTLSPTYSAEKASGNTNDAARLYETALVYSLVFYVPAGAGLMLVAEPLVNLIFGPDYAGAISVLQILGIYLILLAIVMVTGNGLDFLGRARERAIVKGITSIANVGLNIALIPLFGVVGAAIATVVTYSVYTLSNLYIIHIEFGLRIRHLLAKLLRIIVVTGVMAIAVYWIGLTVENWLVLPLSVLAGIAVWAILSTLTGLIEINDIQSLI